MVTLIGPHNSGGVNVEGQAFEPDPMGRLEVPDDLDPRILEILYSHGFRIVPGSRGVEADHSAPGSILDENRALKAENQMLGDQVSKLSNYNEELESQLAETRGAADSLATDKAGLQAEIERLKSLPPLPKDTAEGAPVEAEGQKTGKKAKE